MCATASMRAAGASTLGWSTWENIWRSRGLKEMTCSSSRQGYIVSLVPHFRTTQALRPESGRTHTPFS